jgi:ATP-binding cassette, subfamily F, member 3
VQSRIKAIEREDVVEAVEEEGDGFRFSFEDSGQLGRPIIQIEGVTFGYGVKGIAKPLFKNVHLSIDQSSRIALVGPNGAGKSTLLNLIQNKLRPTEGYIHVNPQLRIAVFTQHHMDDFDLVASPLSNMMKRFSSPLLSPPHLPLSSIYASAPLSSDGQELPNQRFALILAATK